MGRKLAALAEVNHVEVAPHHDCFIHSHLVAGSPAGLIVESFTDPERDPRQAELFENPPLIENGMLRLNDAPGLGLTLRGQGGRLRLLRPEGPASRRLLPTSAAEEPECVVVEVSGGMNVRRL